MGKNAGPRDKTDTWGGAKIEAMANQLPAQLDTHSMDKHKSLKLLSYSVILAEKSLAWVSSETFHPGAD